MTFCLTNLQELRNGRCSRDEMNEFFIFFQKVPIMELRCLICPRLIHFYAIIIKFLKICNKLMVIFSIDILQRVHAFTGAANFLGLLNAQVHQQLPAVCPRRGCIESFCNVPN